MDTPTEAPAPHFGSAYDKARKAYGSQSGLLLAWELIGIELPGAPLENVKVTLKSPQAIPYVLIALVVYFAFRITIEWYQAEPSRRRLWASRVDFTVAHAIGAAALLLYAVQAILRVQIANKLQGLELTDFVFACVCGGATAGALAVNGWSLKRTWQGDKLGVLMVVSSNILLVGILVAGGGRAMPRTLLMGTGFLLGAAVTSVTVRKLTRTPAR